MVPLLALLPSPLLGPAVWKPVARVLADRGWHTVTCAATAPVRTGRDALDAFLATLPMERDVVLVPHSNAGAYVPALVMQRRVVATVFVNAVLPPGRGRVPLAPPAFLDLLRAKADDEACSPSGPNGGTTPTWRPCFTTPRHAIEAEREQQQLPLPGRHLHLLTDPDEVATELLALIDRLGVNSPKS